MRLPVVSFVLFSLLAIAGCDIINPAEPIPTYVRIDSFQFVPTPNTGTASQKITSVWVYFDNKNIGAFDLPATVPILAENAGRLRVGPGVTYSGINDVLTPYAFFLADTMTLAPSPGNVVHWIPKTRYMADTLLNIYNVDFETVGNPFVAFSGPDALIPTNDPNLVYEGNGAGHIVVDSDTASENKMETGFFADKESYVELNYRGTLPFEIGLQSTTGSGQFYTQYLFGYKPRSDWNKVYIGLQDFIAANPGKVYWVMVRVPGSSSGGYVSFDNFKVISRKQ